MSRTSIYAKGIIRLHKEKPKSSLIQLLKKFKPKSLGKLNPKELNERMLSFEALRGLRANKPLKTILKETGLDIRTLKFHLGHAFYKKGRRYVVRKYDSLERPLKIYSKGKIKYIIVKGIKSASLIGKYFNAVRTYLQTGNRAVLEKFRNQFVKDTDGMKHYFETNPDVIREIDEASEDTEFQQIYEES